jgi:hypothetical protein
MKKKNLLWVLPLLVLGMVFSACKSTPKAFETAGSLAGTAWGRLSSTDQGPAHVYEFLDETSGVYTTEDKTETPFTYTASYDAGKRIFTGKITWEDGSEGEFTADSFLFGLQWNLNYGLNGGVRDLTPAAVQDFKQGRIISF